MSWALLIGGGFLAVLPGILDPFAPINGLTLIGILIMFGGVMVTARKQ